MRKLIPLVVLLAGCQYVPSLPGLSAHKIEIQQGNYVTQDMLDKVQPGMTRSQVRFALGTPLVTDPFHADRWDYVFVRQKGGTVVEKRRIVVVFENDRVARIEGEAAPPREKMTGAAAAAKAAAAKSAEAAKAPASKP